MYTTASLCVSLAQGHREHSNLKPPCSSVLRLPNWSCWGTDSWVDSGIFLSLATADYLQVSPMSPQGV